MTPRWYWWLDGSPRPGYLNMALDHALLDLASEEGAVFLRVYHWDPFCLSFGRHEPALRRYPRDRIAARGLDCVRRPTGGRAVWHARELTYAVAAPPAFGSLARAFHRIHEMLAAALRRLGIDPYLAPRPKRAPGPGAGACFAAPVGGEILVAGRKVVGSAQVRSRNGFLQHGSLLLEDDQEVLRELSGAALPVSSDPSAPAAPSALSAPPPLGRSVSFAEAATAVRDAAQDWSAEWQEAPATRVLRTAEAYLTHYRDPAWTWCR